MKLQPKCLPEELSIFICYIRKTANKIISITGRDLSTYFAS